MGYYIIYLHLSFIAVSLLAVVNFWTINQSEEFTCFPLSHPRGFFSFFPLQGRYSRLMAS